MLRAFTRRSAGADMDLVFHAATDGQRGGLLLVLRKDDFEMTVDDVVKAWNWLVDVSNGDVFSLLQYPALAYLIRERLVGHRQTKAMNLNLEQIHARLMNVERNTSGGSSGGGGAK